MSDKIGYIGFPDEEYGAKPYSDKTAKVFTFFLFINILLLIGYRF